MEHGNLAHLGRNIRFLDQAQFWSKDKIADYQTRKFLDLVKFAYHTIPFYKNLYDSWNLDIHAFRSIDDLKKLPFVTKKMMKGMDLSYIDSAFHPSTISWMTTGGSTGNPFKVYMDDQAKSLVHANTYFYMAMAGFTFENSKNIRLHGDVFTQNEIDNGRWFRIQNHRTLVLSSNHISEKTAKLFVEKINSFKPDYIHAFPSSLALLSTCIRQLDLKIEIRPRAIFCDCECLYEYQRDLFKQIFNCKIYTIYGHTEGAVFGINCPESDLVHINPVIGLFELLDQEKPVFGDGNKGEIVVTGFANRVMPFIRYKTEDIGISTTQTCPCQRHWPMISHVEGRKQDYVVDKNQNLVSLTPTLFDYNIDWTGVDRFQVQQKQVGRLNILLKITPDYIPQSAAIQSAVVLRLKESFGKNFDITATLVTKIEFTPKGKYRYLNQHLDIGALWQ